MKKTKEIWEKNKKLNKELLGIRVKYYILLFSTLLVISTFVAIKTTLLEGFRIVFGSVYSLFVPGFFISHALFTKKEIDILERLALSFALSISVIPLIIFYLNLVGFKITTLNSFLTILGVSAISMGVIKFKKRKSKSS